VSWSKWSVSAWLESVMVKIVSFSTARLCHGQNRQFQLGSRFCHGQNRQFHPVPARPTFSVEKLLFSVTLLRGTFSSTAIEIIKWVKNFAVAKVC
jgi:hypothetical protein